MEIQTQALLQELSTLRKRIVDLEESQMRLKHVEDALRESEGRYRSLVGQSSDGVYIFDPETATIVEANDQFLKMVGYDEHEVIS